VSGLRILIQRYRLQGTNRVSQYQFL
jgi:hypothetical protein